MRRRTNGRAAFLAAMATLSMLMAGTGARAHHGTDDARYVEHAGDGNGASGPVIEGFAMLTTAFDDGRFGGRASKYLAYGLASEDLGPAGSQVLLQVMRSDDGLRWTGPDPVLLQEPTGAVPMTVDPTTGIDVVAGITTQRPIELYYKHGRPASEPQDIGVIHRVVSQDGRTFYGNEALLQTGEPVVTGTCCASWKSLTQGPTDVIVQGPSAGNCASAAGSFPWNCRYVMFYDANDGDFQHVGIAGSPDGRTWTGRANPALCPGGSTTASGCTASLGTWDSNSTTYAHVRRISANSYVMYYAGASDDACFGGGAGCFRIGSAVSTNGHTFSRVSASPVVDAALVDRFSEGAPFDATSHIYPSIVDDAAYNGGGHARIFYTVMTLKGSDVEADVRLAYTTPAPQQGPSIRVAAPLGPLRNTTATPVDVYMTDTLGSPAGLNFGTMSMTMDGAPLTGQVIEDTIVTSLGGDAYRVRIPGNLVQLGDGAHVFTVSIADVENNTTTVSTSFEIDASAPVSNLTTRPGSPVVILPGDTVGTFGGTSVEGSATTGTSLLRVRAFVTNPLGQMKSYSSDATSGWTIMATDAKHWSWTWVAPTTDPHFLLPGSYSVHFGAVDAAGNTERSTPANTATLIVI